MIFAEARSPLSRVDNAIPFIFPRHFRGGEGGRGKEKSSRKYRHASLCAMNTRERRHSRVYALTCARGSVLIRETAPYPRLCRTETGSSIKLLINVLLEIPHRANTRARARPHMHRVRARTRFLAGEVIKSRAGGEKDEGEGGLESSGRMKWKVVRRAMGGGGILYACTRVRWMCT